MLLPNRHLNTSDYRYGFQGQEMDDEIKGEGNSINYKFRMHDPRVGRFFSVDPLFKTYPWNSTYAFSENRVIDGTELEGLEFTVQDLIRAKFVPAEHKPKLLQVYDGIVLAAANTAEGIVWMAENPKDALKGTGNFLLGLSTYNSQTPMHAVGQQKYLDQKFGTTTEATMGAFKTSIAQGYDKALNGSVQDKSEIISTLIIGLAGEKGLSYIPKVGLISKLNKIVPRVFSRNFKITNDVIETVSSHLKQFGNKAENSVMLERMRKIANKEIDATEIDKNFAKHELREKQLMDEQGLEYEDAHYQTLKEQDMYHTDYQKKLYTEDAINAGDAQLTKEADGGN